MTTSAPLLYEVVDGVARVTLNRPEALNARNAEMRAALANTAQEANRDTSVKVVVVTGAGDRAFCTGLDLKEAAGQRRASAVEARDARLRDNDLLEVSRIEKPTIAAINGYALGGGLELALACDLRIAAETAQLGFPEVKRGTIPGNGGTQRLVRAVGLPRALEMTFTGEPITAQEALRYGLVNRIVAYDQLEAATDDMARTIAARAPLALRLAKEALHAASDLPLTVGLRQEAALSSLLLETEDFAEGVTAFAEKRTPEWRGR